MTNDEINNVLAAVAATPGLDVKTVNQVIGLLGEVLPDVTVGELVDAAYARLVQVEAARQLKAKFPNVVDFDAKRRAVIREAQS